MKFKIKDKVVFINEAKHKLMSWCYPTVGTIGTVKKINEIESGMLIDWDDAEGIGLCSDGTKSWWCMEKDVKPFCDKEQEYTDDEVWEMLKPKMNQFVPVRAEDIDMSIVKKMVVAAYRSGYGRATKGRNFIIKSKADEKPSIGKQKALVPICDYLKHEGVNV